MLYKVYAKQILRSSIIQRFMKIAIGSKNPGKIESVERAVKKIWRDAEVLAVEVDSGVYHTPNSYSEAKKGANNRARLSKEKTGADYGVGIEGFVIEMEGDMFTCDWATVIDREGRYGEGLGGTIMLPKKIADDVRKGIELTVSLDNRSEYSEVGRNQGAVGVYTNNLVTRIDSMEEGVIRAFARFITSKYYE